MAKENVADHEEDDKTVADTDPDAIALAAMEAEVAAEEAAAEGDDPDKGKQPDEGEAKTDPDPAKAADDGKGKEPDKPDAAEKPQPVMIPKERFDEALRERDTLAQQAAYYKGLAEGAKGAGTTQTNGQQDQPPAKTPEEQLAEINAQSDALAQKFDDGDLTMAEFTKAKRTLDDQAFAIREDQLRASVKPADQPAPKQTEDLYLKRQTRDLVEHHPYLKQFEFTGDAQADALIERRVSRLRDEAVDDLTAAGHRLGNDAESIYLIRQKVAELTDIYGPRWYPNAQIPQKQPPQQRQPGELTPRQEQTQAKIARAENHPPDTHNLGQGELDTEQRVEDVTTQITSGKLSDEELAALPDSILEKVR